ncbi:hypothetical protein J1614_008253 [Plenodomus biglobosus]|nr:hypothetical protein J1614_008253 [Plenodomus biglobosus]
MVSRGQLRLHNGEEECIRLQSRGMFDATTLDLLGKPQAILLDGPKNFGYRRRNRRPDKLIYKFLVFRVTVANRRDSTGTVRSVVCRCWSCDGLIPQVSTARSHDLKHEPAVRIKAMVKQYRSSARLQHGKDSKSYESWTLEA